MFTVILKGEIRNQSLLGVKGLTHSSGGVQQNKAMHHLFI